MGMMNGHEMMVAIAGSTLTHEFINKRVYICFITALAIMLAASPLGSASNIAAADPSAQKALVVRADRRTGKLVRSVAAVNSPTKVTTAPSVSITEMVEKAAHDNNVDPLLVHSIIRVE